MFFGRWDVVSESVNVKLVSQIVFVWYERIWFCFYQLLLKVKVALPSESLFLCINAENATKVLTSDFFCVFSGGT